MAFTEFYCNASTGNNMNGGSDENTSPSYSATNGGWDSGTGVFTPTSGDPSASGVSVGQFAHVFTDGSTTPGFVGRVTAVNSTTVTVSITAKSGTVPTTGASGLSINVGGVWKGPDATDTFPLNGIVAAMTNSAGDLPRVNLKNNATYDLTQGRTANAPVRIEGYTTTPGDHGFAVIRGAASGATNQLFSTGTAGNFRWIHFSRHIGNGSAGFFSNASSGCSFSFCKFSECGASCVTTAGGGSGVGSFSYCEFWDWGKNNTASRPAISPSTTLLLDRCIFTNAQNGANSIAIISSVSVTANNCIFANLGGVGISSSATLNCNECDFYNCASHGLSLTGTSFLSIRNCNFIKNGGWGVISTGNRVGQILNDAYGAGTQANTSGTISLSSQNNVVEEGRITYASNVTPWNDPANGDFNVTLAAAKGTAFSGFIHSQAPSGTLITYRDIGATQHQDTGGSSVKGMRILGG